MEMPQGAWPWSDVDARTPRLEQHRCDDRKQCAAGELHGSRLERRHVGGEALEGAEQAKSRRVERLDRERPFERGARFDSWDEQLQLDAWKAAFADTGVDPERYLGTIPTTARLPWAEARRKQG